MKEGELEFMSFKAIEELVKAPAPGFRCFAAGKKSGARFVARVRHVLNAPASPEAIA